MSLLGHLILAIVVPSLLVCCVVFSRDSRALRMLLKLFIERNYSLWKVPEVMSVWREGGKRILSHCLQVLTWLEENAREVVARFERGDPLIAEAAAK